MKDELERLRWHLAQLKKGYRATKHGQNHLMYLDKIKEVENELSALSKATDETDNNKAPKLLRQLWVNVSELHICAKGGNFPVGPVDDLIEDFKQNLKEILPGYELVKTVEKPIENTIETNEKQVKKSSLLREGLNRGCKLHRPQS